MSFIKLKELFSKPNYQELFNEQISRNTELIIRIGDLLSENRALHKELLEAKAETIRALNGLVLGSQLKQKTARKTPKFLCAQSLDELITKAISALIKYGDNLPQGVLLSAMGRDKSDKTGIKVLHNGIGNLWSVKRDGKYYNYSLIKETK